MERKMNPAKDRDEVKMTVAHQSAISASDKTTELTTFVQLLAECLALSLIVFLVWLDEGILATVIPSISDQFQSFSALAWYAPSYLFGLCAFQLPFGRVYKDFPTRPTFIVSLLVFEVASIIQAAAPNSVAFIIGRVIAGIGGSGVLTGALTILSQEISKSKLPFVMGAFSWVHGVCGITGPIIGGAIASSRLSWRCLLLALQLGGSIYTWSNARSITPLAIAGVLFVTFLLIQRWKGDTAMLPPRIAKLRVVYICAIYSGTLDAAYFVMVYYLPIWFQAIKGVSALDSGYRILPLLAASIICNFSAATLAGKLGYYHPFMMFGSMALTLGTGLVTTLTPRSRAAKWVIFEITAGIGAGSGGQLPLIAVQDALVKGDVPVGYAVVLSSGYLGPTVALAIVQAVFGSVLASSLKQDASSVDPDVIRHTGATDWQQDIPLDMVPTVRKAYNHALTRSWYIAVALAGISLVTLSGLKWKKLDREEKAVQNHHEQDKIRFGKSETGAKACEEKQSYQP
ncbi:MAG: hypothetical protein Q9167_003475 [Letrouitia subvulpina]